MEAEADRHGFPPNVLQPTVTMTTPSDGRISVLQEIQAQREEFCKEENSVALRAFLLENGVTEEQWASLLDLLGDSTAAPAPASQTSGGGGGDLLDILGGLDLGAPAQPAAAAPPAMGGGLMELRAFLLENGVTEEQWDNLPCGEQKSSSGYDTEADAEFAASVDLAVATSGCPPSQSVLDAAMVTMAPDAVFDVDDFPTGSSMLAERQEVAASTVGLLSADGRDISSDYMSADATFDFAAPVDLDAVATSDQLGLLLSSGLGLSEAVGTVRTGGAGGNVAEPSAMVADQLAVGSSVGEGLELGEEPHHQGKHGAGSSPMDTQENTSSLTGLSALLAGPQLASNDAATTGAVSTTVTQIDLFALMASLQQERYDLQKRVNVTERALEEERMNSELTERALEEERRNSELTERALEEERRRSELTERALEEERRKNEMMAKEIEKWKRVQETAAAEGDIDAPRTAKRKRNPTSQTSRKVPPVPDPILTMRTAELMARSRYGSAEARSALCLELPSCSTQAAQAVATVGQTSVAAIVSEEESREVELMSTEEKYDHEFEVVLTWHGRQPVCITNNSNQLTIVLRRPAPAEGHRPIVAQATYREEDKTLRARIKAWSKEYGPKAEVTIGCHIEAPCAVLGTIHFSDGHELLTASGDQAVRSAGANSYQSSTSRGSGRAIGAAGQNIGLDTSAGQSEGGMGRRVGAGKDSSSDGDDACHVCNPVSFPPVKLNLTPSVGYDDDSSSLASTSEEENDVVEDAEVLTGVKVYLTSPRTATAKEAGPLVRPEPPTAKCDELRRTSPLITGLATEINNISLDDSTSTSSPTVSSVQNGGVQLVELAVPVSTLLSETSPSTGAATTEVSNTRVTMTSAVVKPVTVLLVGRAGIGETLTINPLINHHFVICFDGIDDVPSTCQQQVLRAVLFMMYSGAFQRRVQRDMRIQERSVVSITGRNGRRNSGGGKRGGAAYTLGESEAWTLYLVSRDGPPQCIPLPASLALGPQAMPL